MCVNTYTLLFRGTLPNSTKIVVMTMVGRNFYFWSMSVEKSDFLHEVVPHSVFYGHNFIEEPEPFLRYVGSRTASSASRYMERVLSERLHCVGGGTASSASHYVAPLYEAGT